MTRVFERRDRAPFHYMDNIAGFSFGRDGHFATCQESLNNYEGMMTANKVRDRGRRRERDKKRQGEMERDRGG